MKTVIEVDIYEDNIDINPGSAIRQVLENLFGAHWPQYKKISITTSDTYPLGLLNIILHCANGPAAIKYDGSAEWWFEGKKLCCRSQKEFDTYMKLKAFW
jgi:hypothetical protein